MKICGECNKHCIFCRFLWLLLHTCTLFYHHLLLLLGKTIGRGRGRGRGREKNAKNNKMENGKWRQI